MIVLISNPEPQALEAAYVSYLFESGLDRFHLRRPGMSPFQRLLDLLKFPPDLLSRISVHGPVDWAPGTRQGTPLPLVGRHLRKDDPLDILEDCPCRSRSWHSLAEIHQVQKYPMDYAFLSPIFNSISKPDYLAQESLDLQGISKPCPILALGGVDLSNLLQVKERNFDGIALMGAFWQAQDPLAKFAEIHQQWTEINRES